MLTAAAAAQKQYVKVFHLDILYYALWLRCDEEGCQLRRPHVRSLTSQIRQGKAFGAISLKLANDYAALNVLHWVGCSERWI